MRLVECFLCRDFYSSCRYLKVHVKLTHSKLKVFKCSSCDQCFGSATTLKKHLQIVHGLKESFELSTFVTNIKKSPTHFEDKKQFYVSSTLPSSKLMHMPYLHERHHLFAASNTSPVPYLHERHHLFALPTTFSIPHLHERHHLFVCPPCPVCFIQHSSKNYLRCFRRQFRCKICFILFKSKEILKLHHKLLHKH